MQKRRADWLQGRLTAKRLAQAVIAQASGEVRPLRSMVIGHNRKGAPYLRDFCYSLSISHSHGHAFCAMSDTWRVGADIEHIEPRSDVFVSDYFTWDEAERIQAASEPMRHAWATAVWSGKEAGLKLLGIGLGVDTRALMCVGKQLTNEWTPFIFIIDKERIPECPPMYGWWYLWSDFVLTIALTRDHTPVLD